jgi:hypothetical protein
VSLLLLSLCWLLGQSLFDAKIRIIFLSAKQSDEKMA